MYCFWLNKYVVFALLAAQRQIMFWLLCIPRQSQLPTGRNLSSLKEEMQEQVHKYLKFSYLLCRWSLNIEKTQDRNQRQHISEGWKAQALCQQNQDWSPRQISTMRRQMLRHQDFLLLLLAYPSVMPSRVIYKKLSTKHM